MPWAYEQNSGYLAPQSVGPVLLANPSLGTDPTAGPLASNATWDSGVLPSDGYKVVSVGATLSQAGTITVQRYIDQAGTIPQGAASTGTLTADTPNVVNITDGLPFASFRVQIKNTGGASGTFAAFTILLAAA